MAVGNKLKKGTDDKDILKQKEAVVRLLEKQSNRILVVIDDIDRLSNEQIRQVFQLVTSVAKFPNTIYLLVFDKDIVVKALEKVQEGNGEDYLEKIIQMPIQIPEIRPEKLGQILLERLDIILSEHEGTGFHKNHWQKLYEPCIAPFIDSLRTINRLCNAIQFKMAGICTEIDFTDIVAISVIEICFPKVYDWIKANKSILTGEHDLSEIRHRNKTKQEWRELYFTQIHSLLQNNSLNVDSNQIEKVMLFLSYLFPYFGQRIGKTYEVYDSNTFRRNNQIAHPEKFDRYFSLDLDEISIKKADIINAAFDLDYEKLVELLIEQEKKGISYEFLEELRAITPDLPADRSKIIIIALLAVSPHFDSRSKHNLLSLSTNNLAKHMVIELLDTIDITERFQFISAVISHENLNVLQSIAYVINMLELGYGRLAANGEERGYKKVITLDELIQIEAIFTEKVKQVLGKHNLFDMLDWRMICYLLECFDPDYTKSYLEAALKDDANIVRYITGSVGTWTGGGIEYEVTNSYGKYLHQKRALQAIEALKKSGKFFSMSEECQNKCAAFYLSVTTEERNDDGYISQANVDKLLSSWRE